MHHQAWQDSIILCKLDSPRWLVSPKNKPQFIYIMWVIGQWEEPPPPPHCQSSSPIDGVFGLTRILLSLFMYPLRSPPFTDELLLFCCSSQIFLMYFSHPLFFQPPFLTPLVPIYRLPLMGQSQWWGGFSAG